MMLTHNTGDTDYEQGPYMITFPTNITEAFYDISITDDNILEIDEILDITIDSHSLPYDVFVGNGSRAVVIIEDNDCKQLCSVVIMHEITMFMLM